MNDVKDFVKKILQENYDLGEVETVEQIKAGDTNNSFFAFTRRNGQREKWYVRQYNLAEQEGDITYEHAFERYYAQQVGDAMQTMVPLENKAGNTWIYEEFQGQCNYYAVFNVISGLEPYSWEYNRMPQAAEDSCARVCAQFQTFAYGFEAPEGSGRREPPLEELFHVWRRDLPAALAVKQEKPEVFRRFNEYFAEEIPYLLDSIAFCEAELKKCKKKLKICICHKDLNPGNVMFDEDNHITAVFDLDWVNSDYRLYDIAWMGYQAMASWETAHWGDVPVHKIKNFLALYDQTMEEMGSPLGKLSQEEKEFLPVMMIIGVIKVIMDFSCYEDHTHEVHRMFVNTWRFAESVHFMRENLEDIRKAIL